ncbi:hypothetical protein GCM10027449_15260 [Sinomonas notoginsengisoli]|uniref:hypothetical protein n=1 Tax=Sinomonas notoginsengisoli TaxID=1457311 RepID=UPI001F15A27C|nr:hypothetical protein [Sinomonas notoginsengisoli]
MPTEDDPITEQDRRYQQGLEVVGELEPLIASFAKRIKDSGKWPMTIRNDPDTPVPDTLHTGGRGQNRPYLSLYYDGTWLVQGTLAHEGQGAAMLVKRTSGERPQFLEPLLTEPTPEDLQRLTDHPQFGLCMDAVAQLPRWLPAELARYLSEHGIPGPEQLPGGRARS